MAISAFTAIDEADANVCRPSDFAPAVKNSQTAHTETACQKRPT